jgi:hypothetical protein
MVNDLQRASEIMVFMVYVGKWRGGFDRGIAGRECGGLLVWCLVLLVSDECMRPASPLIEQEEPSGASFVLILWRPSCLLSGVPSRRSLQLFSFTVA